MSPAAAWKRTSSSACGRGATSSSASWPSSSPATPPPARPRTRRATRRSCRRILAARLQALGAEVDLWEPEPYRQGQPLRARRPRLRGAAAAGGAARGRRRRSQPPAERPHRRRRRRDRVDDWESDPFRAEVRDGVLYGRGVNDMKGGLASFLFALECLRRAGVRLAGDVVYCANTDEESSGAGSLACVEHGVRADAGICAEPTGFDAWVTCRGTVCPIITVPGRAGHAEMPQPHWSRGRRRQRHREGAGRARRHRGRCARSGAGAPTSGTRCSRRATSCPR